MKRTTIIAFSLFTILLSSCKKDMLDTEPTGSASEASIFATTANAKNVINGIYRYLFNRYSDQNQPGHGGVMLQLDFMGEDLHQAQATWYTTAGSGTGGWVSQRSDASGFVSYPFRLYYRCIGNANAIVDNIDKAEGPDSDKKLLKAEALAMRAWSYFNLVQLFGKRYDAATKPNSQLGLSMPLNSKDLKLPRSTVEEVYTQINKDLDEAITLFGTSPTPSGIAKSHLSAVAAKAIKARVALTMQDYVAAATLAKQVIDAGGFSLMSAAQYQAGFNDITNPEWIWGVYMQADQGDTFGSYLAQISYDGNTTYIRSRPKRINSALYALISNTDVRKKMWEPAPTAANFPLPLSTYVREPYMSRKFAIRTTPTIGDVPYIRLSEMYLIAAEAYAKTAGKEADAQNILFTYVQKRDPNYVKSTNTGQALVDEILIHRRVELWAEGFRFYDLKRLNQALDRTVVPNFVSASVGGTMQIPAGDVRWQFAIPIAEIQANPNTAPNP
ncbi:RagB/SusD family nutrient uptake outer membrane protein [Paraflavitalea soli]|uniref:RagB/SusD family nutrient uptake outer membrane protein n=1 Tax=Paraflavitalea soli TaxID=2315862 RepID=A0A3B7MP20_9BACT|nr:RagB/SusD family nutrient uptake outer membrane protein [Paraflavitalea soli]AXY75527.1 RagB/SusD family nutrient uptake outer membrane protein [Paraflavitalea soli]